jgi:hypothetical protein
MGQNALWRSSFVIRCRQLDEAIAGISEWKITTHGGKKPRKTLALDAEDPFMAGFSPRVSMGMAQAPRETKPN